MNTFLDSFAKEYIDEIQNIPYYYEDKLSKTMTRQVISWFSEEELEQVLESSKNVVANYLRGRGLGWTLEKSAFADDIEEVIKLCMVYNCLKRLLDVSDRDRKTKSNNRLEGVWSQRDFNNFSSLLSEYDCKIEEIFNSIVEKASQNS